MAFLPPGGRRFLVEGRVEPSAVTAHGQPGALHQRPGGRESDAPLLLAGQAITAEGLVVRTFRLAEIPSSNAQWVMDLLGLNDLFVQQQVVQESNFAIGKRWVEGSGAE